MTFDVYIYYELINYSCIHRVLIKGDLIVWLAEKGTREKGKKGQGEGLGGHLKKKRDIINVLNGKHVAND